MDFHEIFEYMVCKMKILTLHSWLLSFSCLTWHNNKKKDKRCNFSKTNNKNSTQVCKFAARRFKQHTSIAKIDQF